MHIFITGLCIGLCLCFAGGITLLRAAFIRATQYKLIAPEQVLFHTLVSRQNRILTAFFIAYGFFILSATMLITHHLLSGLNTWQMVLHCLLLPLFIVVLTFILPRLYLLSQPIDTALSLLPLINKTVAVFTAPALLLGAMNRFIAKQWRIQPAPSDDLVNTADFYAMVTRLYQNEAATHTPEKKDYLIHESLTRFAAMPVTTLMIPEDKLKIMDADQEIPELLSQSFDTSARRILLYQDNPENIMGILHVSLLMKSFCLAEGDKDATDITSAISEPVFIPAEKSVLAQLQDFASQQTKFVLIRDHQHQIKGAIDLETILDGLAADLKKKAV